MILNQKSNIKNQKYKAKAYAYRLLRIRPRSESELNTRLRKKGFGKPVTEEIIALFKESGLIDDAKFARAWVDSRLKTRPKGEIVLKHELVEKGISENIIDEVLSEKKEGEGAVARRLAEGRMERLKGLPKLKAKKKLHDYLARRGFSYDVIDGVICEVVK